MTFATNRLPVPFSPIIAIFKFDCDALAISFLIFDINALFPIKKVSCCMKF